MIDQPTMSQVADQLHQWSSCMPQTMYYVGNLTVHLGQDRAVPAEATFEHGAQDEKDHVQKKRRFLPWADRLGA